MKVAMVFQRLKPQDFLVSLIKFTFGVAIALFIIGLAGAATARYFLTQLATLPERPVYENDVPVATQASAEAPSQPQPEAASNATDNAVQSSEPP